MYVNVEIEHVEQRRVNVIYFNIDVNNVRQHQKHVDLFNIEFHTLIIIKQQVEKSKKIFLSLKNVIE